MALPLNKMLWLAILAGLMVLAEGNSNADKSDVTPTESPKEMSTTKASSITSPPAMEAIADLFKAPLAAFRRSVPRTNHEDGQMPRVMPNLPMERRVDSQEGRAENNTAPRPNRPLLNLFTNAGKRVGSAASSLTGWINPQMVSSTTPRPREIIIEFQPNNQRQRLKKKNFQGNKRKPQGSRRRPVQYVEDEYEDDEYDDEFDDNEENLSLGDVEGDEIGNDDGYDDVEYKQQRKGQKATQSQPHNTYFVVESDANREKYDDIEDNFENSYDDDFDYDYQFPFGDMEREQQVSFTRQRPPKNKKQNQVNQKNKNRNKRPNQKIQNAQTLQFAQGNRPSQTQIKFQRRPAGTTFELIPITQKQAINLIKKDKIKPIKNLGQQNQNQFVVPAPAQGTSQNGQKRPQQYITIPWSQLGMNNQQSKPIFVSIPQQGSNQPNRRTKKPPRVSAKPQKNRFRPPQKNLSPDMSEPQTVKRPQIISNLPMTLGNQNTDKLYGSEMQMSDDREQPDETSQEDMSFENNNEDASEDQPYIVVGADDDNENDFGLSRQTNHRRGFKVISLGQRILSHSDYDE